MCYKSRLFFVFTFKSYGCEKTIHLTSKNKKADTFHYKIKENFGSTLAEIWLNMYGVTYKKGNYSLYSPNRQKLSEI